MHRDDDFFQERLCPGEVWEYVHFDVFFAEKGTIALGVARLISFLFIIALNIYNQYLLKKKTKENVTRITGLILPYYLLYMKIYIGLSLIIGIIDFTCKITDKQVHALIPIEVAIFHWLGEGLAFFLMRYGAGVTAIKRALGLSFLWSIFVFVIFLCILGSLEGKFGISYDLDRGYALFVFFTMIMVIFYGVNIFVPTTILYRRSAMIFFSIFSCIYYLSQIFFATILYKNVKDIICACSVIDFIGVAFVQPLVIYRTLQIDSEYWQGLNPEKGNPLAEVWDHVDVETAQTMADNIEQINRSKNKLPILHFGLLHFNSGDTFVAGGFSRVYFGTLYDQKAAFKILFAMELTPADVREFYREASLLYSLSHENIVICKGICVMPPALTIVLEHCQYGSLFDFLYKPTKEFVAVDHRFDNSYNDQHIIDESNKATVNPLCVENSQELQSNSQEANNNEENKIDNPNEVENSNEVAISNRPSKSILRSSKKVKQPSLSNTNDPTLRGERISVAFNIAMNNGNSVHIPPSNRMSQFSIDNESDRDSQNTFRQSVTMIRRTIDSLASFFQSTPLTQQSQKVTQQSLNSSNALQISRIPVAFTAARAVSIATRLMMMRDAATGIAFLHSKGFMHCDIKSLNFLVDENFRVKLADLGEARPIKGPAKSHLPPIPARNWAPPEVLKKGATAECYTVKSDVYGLSIVLIELLTLELPYGDECDRMTAEEWYHKLTVENYQPYLPQESYIPETLREILLRGIRINPNERPSAVEIQEVLESITNSNIIIDSTRVENNNNNSYNSNSSSNNGNNNHGGNTGQKSVINMAKVIKEDHFQVERADNSGIIDNDVGVSI